MNSRSLNRRLVSVDLLSTVHCAEENYYAELQGQCESYDRVLFELLVDEALTVKAVDTVTGRELRRLDVPLRLPATNV